MNAFRNGALLAILGMCFTALQLRAQNPILFEAPEPADGTATVPGWAEKFADAVMDSQGRTFAIITMSTDISFLGHSIPFPPNTPLPVAPNYMNHALAVVCFSADGQVVWSTSMGSNYTLNYPNIVLDDAERPIVSLQGNSLASGTDPMALRLADSTLTWPAFTQQFETRVPVFRLNADDGSFGDLLFMNNTLGIDGTYGKTIYRHGKFYFPAWRYEVQRLDGSGNVEMRYILNSFPIGITPRDFEVLPDSSVVMYGYSNSPSNYVTTTTEITPVYATGSGNYTLFAMRATHGGAVRWIRTYCAEDVFDSERRAEEVRVLPDGNLLLTAKHVQPTTFAGVEHPTRSSSFKKLLFLRLDTLGNELSGLQLYNELPAEGGFGVDLFGRSQTKMVPMADGSIHFATGCTGTMGIAGFNGPVMGTFNNFSLVVGIVSPQGTVTALDFVRNVGDPKAVLINGTRTTTLANYGSGSSVLSTACMPDFPNHLSMVLTIDHSEPKPLPIPNFNIQYLDRDAGLVRLNNTSQNAQTIAWTFGDGTSQANTQAPIKGYVGGQNYLACISATNLCGTAQTCDDVVLGAEYNLTPSTAVRNAVALVRVNDLARVMTVGSQLNLVRNGQAPLPITNLELDARPYFNQGVPQLDQVFMHNWYGRVDLNGAELGLYHLEVILPGGSVDTVFNIFTVLENQGVDLEIRNIGRYSSTQLSPSILQNAGDARETLRGGRGPHREGYELRNNGALAVGVPVISYLPARVAVVVNNEYEVIEHPEHPSYTALNDFREANGLEYGSYQSSNGALQDTYITNGRAARMHLIPLVQNGGIYGTSYTNGFGQGYSIDLIWRNEHYLMAPVFNSTVLTGNTSVENGLALGEYLRLAAQDVLRQAFGAPGCTPCFTQAENDVMAIYARDINEVRRAQPPVPLQIRETYDIQRIAADILAEVLRTNCMPGLDVSTAGGPIFRQIVWRAMDRFLNHGHLNSCLTTPPPSGGSVLGQPSSPGIGLFVENGLNGGYSGPVTGVIPVTNPVVTPPIAGLPTSFWAPFEGVATGDGYITGTAVLNIDGEILTAPVSTVILETPDPGEPVITSTPDELSFNGTEHHIAADAGPGRYRTWVDPQSDAVKAIVTNVVNGVYSAELLSCILFITDPNITANYSDAEIEGYWNNCMREEYDRINNQQNPRTPGLDLEDLPDGYTDFAAVTAGLCNTPNLADLRSMPPLPGGGVLAMADAYQAYNCAYDPNEKYGPGDNEEEIWVKPGTMFNYRITFENIPEASAAAQVVQVIDQLDTAFFDLSTVRLTSARIGMEMNMPLDNMPGSACMSDLRPNVDHLLLLETDLASDGTLQWTFTALDVDDLQPTTDALGGFLQPNDSTGRGHGVVDFTVQLKPNVLQGEFINNQGDIIFDVNNPIQTQVWRNKVDGVKPTSAVDPLPFITMDTLITLSWQVDDSIGVVRHVELWISVDQGPFVLVGRPSGNSTFMYGRPGGNYRFYTIAVDMAGNREDIPADGFDAETTIDESVAVEEITSTGGLACFPNPTLDKLTLVTAEDHVGGTCSIFDVHGRLVYTQRIATQTNTLPTADLAPSTYVIVVANTAGELSRIRFVKQ